MDLARLLGLTIHTIAFVTAWGYYGILARIMLPALERSLDGATLGGALWTIERRAVPLLLASVVLFLVTGTYLLLVDPAYEGLGAIRGSWSTLMLVKHLMVAAFVALGVLVHFLVQLVDEAEDDVTRTVAVRRVRWAADAATGLGALVALLTVAARLSA